MGYETQAGQVQVIIGASTVGLDAGLARASGKIATFGRTAAKMGMGLSKFVTLPVLAAGAASVVMAAKFQGSMELIHTQAGGTAKDVEVLTKAVLELGAKGQHGPQELSDALYHLKSVGKIGRAHV